MVPLGARVRVADRDALLRLGRVGSAAPRLGPGQQLCAGRRARVVGARREADGRFVYALEGLPGSWPAAALLAPDGRPHEPAP